MVRIIIFMLGLMLSEQRFVMLVTHHARIIKRPTAYP